MPAKESDLTELAYLKMLGFKCKNFGINDTSVCRYGGSAPIPCCIFCEHKEECAIIKWENNVEGPCKLGHSYCWKYFKWRETHRE